jgi:hypothetical protein
LFGLFCDQLASMKLWKNFASDMTDFGNIFRDRLEKIGEEIHKTCLILTYVYDQRIFGDTVLGN